MRRQYSRYLAALAILGSVGCAGTATSDPSLLASHREALVLEEEPDGAVGILDARDALLGDQTDEGHVAASVASSDEAEPHLHDGHEDVVGHKDVVIVGQVGGIPNPWKQAQPDYPWTAGQAQFVLSDAAAAAEVEEHGHTHEDPDHDCPFCASAANSDAVAVIRFEGENGQLIPIDARELFDLEGQETVVVRGTAQIRGDAQTGVLTVDADGIYVRR